MLSPFNHIPINIKNDMIINAVYGCIVISNKAILNRVNIQTSILGLGLQSSWTIPENQKRCSAATVVHWKKRPNVHFATISNVNFSLAD